MTSTYSEIAKQRDLRKARSLGGKIEENKEETANQ